MDNRSVRVLVVDDSGRWRELVCSTLRNHGFQVIDEAGDGREAVEKIEAQRPELVVLDIGLPMLNGIEVARQLRTVAPETKVVFLTENQDCDVAEIALSEGALGYVLKSAFANELIPAIGAVMESRSFLSAKLMALSTRPDGA